MTITASAPTLTDVEEDSPETEELQEELQEAEAFEDTPEYKKLRRKVAWKRRAFEAADFLLVVTKAALLILFIAAVTPFFNTFAHGHAYNTILSGSMEGTANVGDLVVTKPYLGEDLTEGTVVLIQNQDTSYLHRIVEVNRAANGSIENYSTRGDANKNRDLFKPTPEDLTGLAIRYIHQPEAGFYAAFTLNATWAESMWKAVSAGDWHAAGQLMPYAPFGFLLLVLAVFVFWWLVPDLLTHLKNRALAKYELTIEGLRRTVSDHDESLTTIEPMVVELKTDHDAAIAEKAAEEQAFRDAQAKAWDAFDPTAPIYDEPIPFDTYGGTPAITGASLDDLPEADESNHTPTAPLARNEASAFYIEEEGQ